MNYTWETIKPILITGFTGAYAIFNAKVLAFLQSAPYSEQYLGFDLFMYFVVKISAAISAVGGAVFIVYRIVMFHKKGKTKD